ncbi:MAG: CBS domain-containing protein [Actinomycetota bacterium]
MCARSQTTGHRAIHGLAKSRVAIPETLSPDDTVEDAAGSMRAMTVRRLPVVEEGRAVRIFSIRAVAVARDNDSALADISRAEPNK